MIWQEKGGGKDKDEGWKEGGECEDDDEDGGLNHRPLRRMGWKDLQEFYPFTFPFYDFSIKACHSN